MRRRIVCFVSCLGLLHGAFGQTPPAAQIGTSSQDFGGIRTFLRAPHVKDIAALDPGLAPGTGTVELGGLTFHQMHELLVRLPAKGRVVGFDVVEVNPFFDSTGVAAQTAARLIIDLAGATFRVR